MSATLVEAIVLVGVVYAAWTVTPPYVKSRLLGDSRRWATKAGILSPPPATNGALVVEKKKLVEDLTPGRVPGEWRTTDYTYPDFDIFSGDIKDHDPLPFRPFRWGDKYPINLGVYPMKWDMWLEVDNEYLRTHSIRQHRKATRGHKAVRTLPWDYPLVPSSIPMAKPVVTAPYPSMTPTQRATPSACAKEVLSEMASYLAIKYPSLYRVEYGPLKTPTGEAFDVDSSGNSFVKDLRVKTVEMVETGEKWDVDEEDPMKLCGLLLQDDLAIMQEREDGQVYFVAGSICTAGFWRLEDKIGLPLDEIHQRGRVPKFKEKLQFSMNRFFLKLPVDKPVTRNNYFFQLGDDLSWSDPSIGPEDIFCQTGKGPKEGAEGAKDFVEPQPTKRVEDVWYRTERQTLRRMPKTGCILFTIRTYFLPVVKMAKEPGVPGRLANAIRTWPEDVAWYKGLDLYRDAILPWLDDLHAKQVADGITTADNQDRTYPF